MFQSGYYLVSAKWLDVTLLIFGNHDLIVFFLCFILLHGQPFFIWMTTIKRLILVLSKVIVMVGLDCCIA